ncbi:thyrostimulin alpha-2 subunit-like [Anneissia japonica]|uniref:thyrostimulin alpha-2 subunit-like n=1 Tax=Anneissia japonica TaxID=1529436 RepID=UPI0014259E9B|nr:thyrostimulin alpha-2 subunit-like [Anneissia japonica]XP_033105437.1 thyrostimulin alpha-2 subunit-like [Anneissia japonica]
MLSSLTILVNQKMCLLLKTFVLVAAITLVNGNYWEQPGCHVVGYTKEVRIPGCHVEYVQMNACRGYCMSYSFLSSQDTLQRSGGLQVFSSYGSCCTIGQTHDVNIVLQCVDNQVYRDTFRSARTCECSLCDVSD